MTGYEQISLRFLLLLFYVMDNAAIDACSDDELYVIRCSDGKLVLDGSEPPAITIQYFTGYSPQLWQFKRGSKAGLYYIVNNHTGNPLDFVRNDLVMRKRKETLQQQWSLTLNGRIVNAVNRRNVDVIDENYTAASRVKLVEENGNKTQEFNWEMLAVRPNFDSCKYLLR